MFVTDYYVIMIVSIKEDYKEEIAASSAHMTNAGNSHYTAQSDEEALDAVHDLVAYLPSNNRQQAPLDLTDFEEEITEADLKLDEIIPDSPTQPYDVREVIESLSDDGEFLEIQAERAENVVVAFGRIEGQTVGFVANQPTVFAGCLDRKSTRLNSSHVAISYAV